MKVGDLVVYGYDGKSTGKEIGIITHLWVGGSAAVLFKDGEVDVDEDDLEVISEDR